MPDRKALAVLLAGSLWLAPVATAQTLKEPAANDQQRSAPEPARSVDSRTQYPAFLSNSYFGFDVGSINYAFSSAQLEPGFRAESVTVPHAAARLILYGHQFGRF